ncbi:MAG: aldehyde dehydrogenase family protein [Acidobacteria bacterium]|nr:aldehyde dehydrogenase family protein [Acidobacteriota bacterium]
MATGAPAQTDKDLASIAEARALARRARAAQALLAEYSQAQIDAIVDAMAAAVTPHADTLARLAVEETGYGVVADKVQKNLFASEQVHAFIKPMATVGVVRRDEAKRIVEIAEPFGVVAAIVPSTNPTSTAIYKLLISIKARCAVVLSPHPSAARCITRTAEIMHEAARRAGLPDGAIGWMTTVTLEGTQELMKAREVSVILATGGMGLVRAAYSAGKPAYGVGPGNAPCYIESSADVSKAARDIVTGKSFDNGVLCSSPNSVVVERAIDEEARRAFAAHGGHFLSAAQGEALAKLLITPQRLPNPALVGKSAAYIAEKLGAIVPPGTRALLVELAGVGRDFPLSIEKLCPVLSYYVVSDWREGCERCKQILRYGGMGHTMSIHSRNEAVILEFGLHKPAFRIVVNTPTTHGSIGLTTGLDPAMTLGCGGFGGNITSDNITPRHLLNIKRVAYGIREVAANGPDRPVAGLRPEPLPVSGSPVGNAGTASQPPLPRPPARPVPEPVSASTLSSRIDQFLAARGVARPGGGSGATSAASSPPVPALTPPPAPASAQAPAAPVPFVCEDDVRAAIRDGRKILVGERTIITPAARDAGEAARVFTWEGWRL